MLKRGGTEVHRISGARTGLTEDVRGRQRRYIISMSVRTVSVILTVVLWNVERPLAWATLVIGMLLPYVAVVVANAGRENAPQLPASYIPPPFVPALEAGAVETAAERAAEHATDYAAGHTAGHTAGRGPEPVPEP
jgi:hypothetical protein